MADRTLTVKIVGDSRSLERAFSRSSRATETFGQRTNRALRSFTKGLAFGGVAASVGGLAAALKVGIDEFSDAQKVAAQTGAVLRSTGGVANVTAKQIESLSESLSRQSGIDDELIARGENLLLTFKNVRNEVGLSNKIFDRATRAAVDLSVAGFGSIETTSKQLGKALNDPVRGMTALGRAGVTFTASQRKQIAAMAAANNLLGAQRLILKEVESQVVGSAKALGQTLPGQVNRLRETFRNFAGDLVAQFAPAISGTVERLTAWFSSADNLARVQERLTQIVDTARGVFEGISRAFQNVAAVVRPLNSLLGGTAHSVEVLIGLLAVAKVRAFAIALGLLGTQGKAAATGIEAAGAASTVATTRLGRMAAAAAFLRNPVTLVIGIEILRGGKELKDIRDGVKELGSDVLHGRIKKAFGADSTEIGKFRGQFREVEAAIARLPKSSEDAARGLVASFSQDPTKPLKQRIAELLASIESLGPAAARASASIEAVRGSIDAAIARTENFGAAADAAAAGGSRRTGITAEQRNTFFDRLIGRREDRVQDIRNLEGQLKELDRIAALIRERLAKTKDITRQQTLEDQLLDITRQQRGIRQQIVVNAAESKRLALETQREKILKERERVAARIAARLVANRSRQFRALGLTAEGDEPIPGVRALRRQRTNLADAIKGTFLDTGKTRSLLQRIRKVLSGGMGAIGRDVRAKIA